MKLRERTVAEEADGRGCIWYRAVHAEPMHVGVLCLLRALPSAVSYPTRGGVGCEEACPLAVRASAEVRGVCVLGCGRCGDSAFCEVKLS